MNSVFAQALATLPHLGHLPDLHRYPAWLSAPAHLTPQYHPLYIPGDVHGEAHHAQETFRSESWELPPGEYHLNAYHLGQWIQTTAVLEAHQLTLHQAIEIAPPGRVVLVELLNPASEDARWTVMVKALPAQKGQNPRFQIYKTLLQHTQRQYHLHNPEQLPTALSIQVSNGAERSLFGIQQAPSVLDVTGQRVNISAEDACKRFADLLLAHRPPYGRTFVYADGGLDLFDHFALQEAGRLLGVRNLYGSSIWGAEALATGESLLGAPARHHLSDILALENPLYLFNGWNGLLHHPIAFEKLAAHPSAQIWVIDSLVQESAKYLLAQHPRCEVLLVRPGSEGLLALCIARCLMESSELHSDARSQDPGFLDYKTVAQSSIFDLDPMVAELVADPEHTEQLKEQILRLAQALADPHKQAAHIPGNGLFQSGGTQAYCLWQNLLQWVGKRYEWQSFETRNEGLQLEHLGPERFFGNIPLTATGCREAAQRMGLPPEAYDALLQEHVRPIQDFLKPSQGHQRELIICIGHGLEARWLRDHEQWYEKIRATDAILVVIDSMPGPFMLDHAALCLPLSPEISQYQLCQEGLSHWYHDLPQKQAPEQTRSTASWWYRTLHILSQALQKSEHIQQGHPDLYRYEAYLTSRFSEAALPFKANEVCRKTLWERIQAYMQHQGPYHLDWESLLSSPQLALEPPETPGTFQYFVPQPQDFSQPRESVLNIGSSIPNATFQAVQHAIKVNTRGHAYDYGTMPKARVLYVAAAWAKSEGLQEGDAVHLQQADATPLHCHISLSEDLKGKTLYFSSYLSQEELHTGQLLPWNRFQAQVCPYSQVPLLKKVQVHCQALNTAQESAHA